MPNYVHSERVTHARHHWALHVASAWDALWKLRRKLREPRRGRRAHEWLQRRRIHVADVPFALLLVMHAGELMRDWSLTVARGCWWKYITGRGIAFCVCSCCADADLECHTVAIPDGNDDCIYNADAISNAESDNISDPISDVFFNTDTFSYTEC